jgi:hypothetical protein
VAEGHAVHVEEVYVAGERLLFLHANIAQHEYEFEAAARGEGSRVSVTELVERHPASGWRQPLHREHVPAAPKVMGLLVISLKSKLNYIARKADIKVPKAPLQCI